MNKRLIFSAATVVASLAFAGGCSSDKDIRPPEIVSSGSETCPLNCQQFERGEVIEFCWRFVDDYFLGSFNIEIHSNSDHHTHSTEAEDCGYETDAEPVNPWIYNKDFTIPEGSKSFDARVSIPIPSDVDPGEYHFMIRVTDAAGWQQIRSVGIVVL